jgi:hypothetical protein
MDQNKEPPRIIFEGEESQHSARSFNSENPKIVQWVIKYSGGYIKDEKQASYVMIGFVAVAIIISLFLIFGGGNTQETFAPSAEAPSTNVNPPAEF